MYLIFYLTEKIVAYTNKLIEGDTVKKDTTINIFAKTLGQECIAMRIRVISRAISRIYDESLRPHGLKSTQLSILAVISILGQADPTEICRILYLDASTLSRNMTRMRTKGWLETSPAQDRRAHKLRLTREGNRLLTEAFPAWREAQNKIKVMLGGDNLAAIGNITQALWYKSVRG